MPATIDLYVNLDNPARSALIANPAARFPASTPDFVVRDTPALRVRFYRRLNPSSGVLTQIDLGEEVAVAFGGKATADYLTSTDFLFYAALIRENLGTVETPDVAWTAALNLNTEEFIEAFESAAEVGLTCEVQVTEGTEIQTVSQFTARGVWDVIRGDEAPPTSAVPPWPAAPAPDSLLGSNPAGTAWTFFSLGTFARTTGEVTVDNAKIMADSLAFGADTTLFLDNGGTQIVRAGATLEIEGGANFLIDGQTVTSAATGDASGVLTGTLSADRLPTATTSTRGAITLSAIPFAQDNQQFVFVGDSLTAGLTSPNTVSYPAALASRPPVAGQGVVTNYGGYGGTLTDLISTYSAQPYTKRPEATGASQSVLFVWVGANDYTYIDFDPVAWYASLTSYLTTARADGFKIVLFTIMRRITVNQGDAEWAYLDGLRQQANRMILSTPPSLVDVVVDAAALFPDPTDTTLFLDLTHLSDRGNQVLAAAVADRLMGQGLASTAQPAMVSLAPTPSEAQNAELKAASLTFKKPNGFGNVSPVSPATGTTAATLEACARFDAITNGNTVYFISGPTGMNLGYIAEVTGLGGRIFLEGASAYSDRVVFVDTWAHFAATRDAFGVVTYYYNGVACGTATISTNWTSGISRLNQNGKNVLIARPRVYNYALSAMEVARKAANLGVLDSTELIASQTAVAATTALPGLRYRITTVGTTDYTAAGASANSVGVEFVATAVPTGSGTVTALGAIFALDDADRHNGNVILDRAYGAAHCTTDGTSSFITSPRPVLPSYKTGVAQIGSGASYSGFAEFGDAANFGSAANYAFLADPSGDRYINARTGKAISFRVNNVQVAAISAAGLSGNGSSLTGITAGQVSNTPAGGIAANTVQAALNELDVEKAPLASPVFTGSIRLPQYTVAGLAGIASPNVGMMVFATDLIAPAFGVAAAGGGAVGRPVHYDGANWVC